MKSIIQITIAVLTLLMFVSCSEEKSQEVSKEMEMKADKEMQEHSIGEVKSELIREGVIDVVSLDKNSDGKIYECPMDWNVLADEYHDCPVCGMKMKEYSLVDIKKNLDKYGYEYKK